MVYREVVAQHRSRDEWARLVARWRASGKSGKRFAERHGLSASSLYDWGRRLETDEVEVDREPAFAELRVVDRGSSARLSGLDIVTHSGRVVRVSGEVDPDQLRTVLEVVEGC